MAKTCDQERKISKKHNWTIDNNEEDFDKFFPPLYGVPISIKDLFDMKGLHSTIGITHKILTVQEKDSSIITCFRNAGMIPFARTNVPQLAMIFECNNFLWGRSVNIWNK